VQDFDGVAVKDGDDEAGVYGSERWTEIEKQ
jgi:hypothetical protein